MSPAAKSTAPASEQVPPHGDSPAGKDAPLAQAVAPARKTPVKEAPVKEAPVKEAPVKETPARKAPVKKAAAKRAAAKAVPPVELTVRTPAKRPASRPAQPTLPPREAETAAQDAVPATESPDLLVTETAPAEPTAAEATPPVRGADGSASPEPEAGRPIANEPAAVKPAGREQDKPTSAGVGGSTAEAGLGSLTEELLADPARSPEILAHTAVQHIGPRARAWAAQTRASYPTATTEAIARLAVQRFTRSAGIRGGLGALAGPYAPVALVATTVITHAELVLHLAAVYGLDPADPRRAGDLLALAAPGKGPIVLWAALKLVRLPGVSLLTAVLGARATTEMVAVRARRFYAEYSSQDSQESGSSS
ncbi:hypothetical protein BJ964_001935 [Actinoplanes lobatus]|uniref:Uncharacterized protein n=1 Tax=Actinoplanes lobatus TaxID=113568 RepID=A0A7W7HC31_9ACTN|nr:hypothetical protein [Actinoplanes lobatus]MBB4747774.1 hypothetical protein [Actinoplanes lobatus]